MKRITLFILLLFVLCCAGKVRAQTQQVQVNPNCQISFSFTVAGSSAGLANYGAGSPGGGNGCTSWVLLYANIGFTAYTVTVQSAQAATTTTPGTWGTYGGTVESGSNPVMCSMSCAPSSGQTFLSNGTVGAPWIRVTVSGLSGSGVVFGILQGYTYGSGSGGGGGGSGCAGTVATPCVTGAENSSLAAVTDNTCDMSAVISISGSGLTQIVAASSGKKVRICHVSLSNSAGSTVQLEYGTGTNCGMGTAALTGVYQNVATMGLDFPVRSELTAPSGDAVCLNYGTSVTAGGTVVYAQF